MPAVIGISYGGVVSDDKACQGFCGPTLRAVPNPEHVPTVAIRGQRLRGGGRTENMSASEGELGELGFQRDVPISVIFKN